MRKNNDMVRKETDSNAAKGAALGLLCSCLWGSVFFVFLGILIGHLLDKKEI